MTRDRPFLDQVAETQHENEKRREAESTSTPSDTHDAASEAAELFVDLKKSFEGGVEGRARPTLTQRVEILGEAIGNYSGAVSSYVWPEHGRGRQNPKAEIDRALDQVLDRWGDVVEAARGAARWRVVAIVGWGFFVGLFFGVVSKAIP